MHESTCSKDYALKPPGLKSDSLIRRRREATPRPRPRPGAGRGEPGSRRKPGGWGSPSWSELDTDIHMVLKKGWPGTLPETSPVTCPWPRDQILHALPEAHPLAMGRWGAAARPGGRKCTHTPRQRIKCSPAGISAPPRRPNLALVATGLGLQLGLSRHLQAQYRWKACEDHLWLMPSGPWLAQVVTELSLR